MAFRNVVILSDHSLNMTGPGRIPKRRVRHNKLNKPFIFSNSLLMEPIISDCNLDNKISVTL